MTRIWIVGAGGFGREVLGYLRDLAKAGGDLEIAGFLDDRASSPCCELPVVRLEELEPSPDERFVIAVGSPRAREDLATRALARGCRFFTLIHPLAYVASTATVGEGAIISPFAFVGPSAQLGDHVVLNVFSGADHESVVERFAYLAPHSFVGGGARVGRGAVLELHSGVDPGAAIAAGARVHRSSSGG